jgi:hypothetical protein
MCMRMQKQTGNSNNTATFAKHPLHTNDWHVTLLLHMPKPPYQNHAQCQLMCLTLPVQGPPAQPYRQHQQHQQHYHTSMSP